MARAKGARQKGKPTTTTAEQLLEKAYDSTVQSSPPQVRKLAMSIAVGYSAAVRAYDREARQFWRQGWQLLYEHGGIPKHMCAARLRTMIESCLVELHAKNPSVPLRFTSGYYKLEARKAGYAAPRPSVESVSGITATEKGPGARLMPPVTPSVAVDNDNDNDNADPTPSPEARRTLAAQARQGGPATVRTPALGMKAATAAAASTPLPPSAGEGATTTATAISPPGYVAPAERNNASLVAVLQYTRRVYRMMERALEGVEQLPVYMDQRQLADLENSLIFVAQACADALNRKTLIPPTTHAIFHELYRSQASLLNVGSAILRWRADRMADVSKFMTARQAAKFLKGQEPSQLPLYEPKSREEAVFMRWYGLPCPACESWRVRETQNIFLSEEEALRIGDDSRPLLQCWDCNHMWRGYTVMSCVGPHSCGMLFYREDLVKIKRTGACPSCKKEIRLPDHLLQYLAHPETWWQKKRRHPRPRTAPKEVLP